VKTISEVSRLRAANRKRLSGSLTSRNCAARKTNSNIDRSETKPQLWGLLDCNDFVAPQIAAVHAALVGLRLGMSNREQRICRSRKRLWRSRWPLRQPNRKRRTSELRGDDHSPSHAATRLKGQGLSPRLRGCAHQRSRSVCPRTAHRSNPRCSACNRLDDLGQVTLALVPIMSAA
jgi:hypothetical protein